MPVRPAIVTRGHHVRHGIIVILPERSVNTQMMGIGLDGHVYLGLINIRYPAQFLHGRLSLVLLLKLAYLGVNLCESPTWFKGNLTIRLCSAIACKMLWRIHHTA